jgi:hypothetical protein
MTSAVLLMSCLAVAAPHEARAQAGLIKLLVNGAGRAAVRAERAAVSTERVAAHARAAGVVAGGIVAVEEFLHTVPDFESSALFVRADSSALHFYSTYAPPGYTGTGSFKLVDPPADLSLAGAAQAIKRKIDASDADGDASMVKYIVDGRSAADQGLGHTISFNGVQQAYLIDDNGVAWPMTVKGNAAALDVVDSAPVQSDDANYAEKIHDALDVMDKLDKATNSEATAEPAPLEQAGATSQAPTSGGGVPGWMYVVGAIVLLIALGNVFKRT